MLRISKAAIGKTYIMEVDFWISATSNVTPEISAAIDSGRRPKTNGSETGGVTLANFDFHSRARRHARGCVRLIVGSSKVMPPKPKVLESGDLARPRHHI